MRLGVRVSGLAVVVLCVSAGTALAVSAPKLKLAAVEQIALRATQTTEFPNGTYQPDRRVTVKGAKLGREGKTLVWLVRVHATVTVFPCTLAPLGAPASDCMVATSKNGLVTIADTTGRVLNLQAVNAAGHVLAVNKPSAPSDTSPCPGVPYAPPPPGAPPAPTVTCSPGLVGIGNVGVAPAQLAAEEAAGGGYPSVPLILLPPSRIAAPASSSGA